MDLSERFWSKVNILGEDDCWEWLCGGRGNGYGCFKFEGKSIDSHRMVWFLIYGIFPEMLVCHSCDNRKCCNPKHLLVGTHQDNSKDAFIKGRQKLPKERARGEKAGNVVLTERTVINIKRLLKENKYTHKEISKMFNVSRPTITNIASGDTWAHIKI